MSSANITVLAAVSRSLCFINNIAPARPINNIIHAVRALSLTRFLQKVNQQPLNNMRQPSSSVDNGTILTILDPVEGCCRVEHRTEQNDHYICKV